MSESGSVDEDPGAERIAGESGEYLFAPTGSREYIRHPLC